MQLPSKIGNCKIFANFCLVKKQAIRQQTIDIQNPALNTIAHFISAYIMVYISPLRIYLKQSLFLASNPALCNKRKSVTKVSSLVYSYSISKTVGIFTDNKNSITAVFIVGMKKKTSIFCFSADSRKVTSSIKHCLYTTLMLKFSKL